MINEKEGKEMKPTFKFNTYGVKSSCDQYRNIGGVHYANWTADTGIFEEEKGKAKKAGLKYKIIKGELYLEVK